MLRVSSGLVSLGFFCLELVFPESSTVFQEREDDRCAGLVVAGGTKAGGAPRSSAWRRRLARASSRDCETRVTRSPIWRSPLRNSALGMVERRRGYSKVTLVIGRQWSVASGQWPVTPLRTIGRFDSVSVWFG